MPVGTTSRDEVVEAGLLDALEGEELCVIPPVSAGVVSVAVVVIVTVLLEEAHSLPEITCQASRW